MKNLRDDYDWEASLNNIEAKSTFIRQQHEQLESIFELLQSLIKGSDISSLEVSKDNVIANLDRPKISLELNFNDSRSCALETLNFKRYESKDSPIIYGTFDYLCSAKSTSPIFFDIGANEGIYKLSALKREKPLEVHAFEAVPETVNRLKANLIRNGVSLDHLNKVAVSETISSTKFTYVPGLSGSSSFKNLLNHQSARTIEVKTISLDSYCDFMEVRPDFIKIDVEGSEGLVINGFTKTLNNINSKPIMFVEILRKWSAKYGRKANDTYKQIISIGYKGYTLDQRNNLTLCPGINDETIATNFLFLPNDFTGFEALQKSISCY